MCGATLDTSSKTEDFDRDTKKSGRVRQRTVSEGTSSHDGDELNDTARKIREEMGATSNDHSEPSDADATATNGERASAGGGAQSDRPTQKVPFAEKDEGFMDDPLGAYIEEVDVVQGSQNQEGGTLGGKEKSVETPSRGKASGQATNGPRTGGQVFSPRELAPRDSINGKPGDDAKPRVVLESGTRRAGKPSNLSFGHGKEEAVKPRSEQNQKEFPKDQSWKPAANNTADRTHREQDRVKASRPDENRREAREPFPRKDGGPRTEVPRTEVPRTDVPRADVPRADVPGGDGDRVRERFDSAPRREEEAPHAREGARRQEGISGRLFGWLVNYANPDGKATELREGKFFVTRTSLKENDLIINDGSISTPHALIIVSTSGGLVVQDLMSDRGIFLRKRGTSSPGTSTSSPDAYQKITDKTPVENGDWIRFGDVEFLTCLVAHVGAR